jgi:hypothetical protein
MIASFLQHVPPFVWLLLFGLIALGVSMSFTRRRSLRSAIVIPLAMIMLSFYGVASAFGQAVALAAWLTGVMLALGVSGAAGLWSTIRWSQRERRLVVPGSWIPMAMLMGLFITKFIVNAMLGMHPERGADSQFAALAGFAYGAFSGMFLARGVAMLKVARRGMQDEALA